METEAVAPQQEMERPKQAPLEPSFPSNLTETQKVALEAMRKTFLGREGYGMAVNDKTLLRYLRAR